MHVVIMTDKRSEDVEIFERSVLRKFEGIKSETLTEDEYMIQELSQAVDIERSGLIDPIKIKAEQLEEEIDIKNGIPNIEHTMIEIEAVDIKIEEVTREEAKNEELFEMAKQDESEPTENINIRGFKVSRHAGPSQAQLEKLIGIMEKRPDLVTGHARTAYARIQTRKAWTDISEILNRDGNGCIKNWKLWSKYWKDKKAAVKRKANMAETARQKTGAGVDTQMVELTDLDQRILTIAGGQTFAMGNKQAVNPLSEQENIALPPEGSEPFNTQSRSILSQGIPGSSSDHIGVTAVEDEPSRRNETIGVFVRDTSLQLSTEGDEAVSVHRTNQGENDTVSLSEDNRFPEERTVVRESPPVAVRPRGGGDARRRTLMTTPSPLRRLLQSPLRRGGATHSSQRYRDFLVSPRAAAAVWAARRRPLRRSPPSQRRSEIVNLTERFIAIEERRVEVEHALARSVETFAQGHRMMAEVLSKLTDMAQQIIEGRQQI